MPKVYIIFYTTYHHIYKLALEVQKGLEAQGMETKLFQVYRESSVHLHHESKTILIYDQVPETLSDEVLEKMHAPPKPDVPVITVDQLKEADGFMFGKTVYELGSHSLLT